jgi:hypothetical protein
MGKMVVKVGPSDHGRRMSLQEFDKAEVQEGYLYELGRGVIVVSDVLAPRHLPMVNVIRRQLMAYDQANPGRIYCSASGSECHPHFSFAIRPCNSHNNHHSRSTDSVRS